MKTSEAIVRITRAIEGDPVVSYAKLKPIIDQIKRDNATQLLTDIHSVYDNFILGHSNLAMNQLAQLLNDVNEAVEPIVREVSSYRNKVPFSTSVTFEDFLKNNAAQAGLAGSEFRLVINQDHPDGTLEIYCHPLGRDGETYEGYVNKFTIDPKKAIDNLLKYLCKKQPNS